MGFLAHAPRVIGHRERAPADLRGVAAPFPHRPPRAPANLRAAGCDVASLGWASGAGDGASSVHVGGGCVPEGGEAGTEGGTRRGAEGARPPWHLAGGSPWEPV